MGKSHLIRWVNAKIPAKAGRHVIYLQKTQTSLKEVIEALLVDQHDPELDEIRRRISSLGSGVTADEMEHKILAELAEALRTARADNPYGKALVGEKGLRLFFTDPLFEHHLLRPGSFIKRRPSMHSKAARLMSLMCRSNSPQRSCPSTSWTTTTSGTRRVHSEALQSLGREPPDAERSCAPPERVPRRGGDEGGQPERW